LESIRLNYEALQATWEEAVSVVRELEVKARINGVAAIMKTFDFLFGLILAERILKHTNNLSKTLQTSSLSAVEACSILKLCVTVFEKIRTNLCFDQFWAIVEITRQSLDISEPSLPRQRKRPRRYEDGNAQSYYPVEPKVHYRQVYFQAIDSAIAIINDHFSQADYDVYAKLEQVLLLAAKIGDYSSELKEVTEFYKDDFNNSELETQLEIFSQMKFDCAGDNITFQDICKHKIFASFPSCLNIMGGTYGEICASYASHQCHI